MAGLDDKILGLYAGGMTVRDISAHLAELYGVEIGRDTISRVTDAVLEDVAAWRTRPLDQVYPIVYFDAMFVKVREDRSRPATAPATSRSGSPCDGDREVLGLWWQDDRGREVLAGRSQRPPAPRRRGRPDRLRRRPQRLPRRDRGDVPAGLGADLHRASHPRLGLRYVNYRDRKKVAAALRPIYTAANADAALTELERFEDEWGDRYPLIAQAWRRDWEHVIPFLSLPDELRRAVYTTNTIEGLHRQVRKAIKTRGHFPDEQAATKLIYLAIDARRRQMATQPHLDSTHAQPSRSTSQTDSQADHNTSPRPHTQKLGRPPAPRIRRSERRVWQFHGNYCHQPATPGVRWRLRTEKRAPRPFRHSYVRSSSQSTSR